MTSLVIPASKTPNTVQAFASATMNLRSSSDYDSNHGVKNSLLNFKNDPKNPYDGAESWSAGKNDLNQYILAGSDVEKTFVALAIQGRGDNDQWVKTFKLTYSVDNLTWFSYENGKEFVGSRDRDTPQVLFFDPPIQARSICLHPTTWHNHISLRWELYYEPLPIPPQFVSGSVQIGDRSLNNPTGDNRTVERQVVFPKPLKSIPRVYIGLRYIDSGVDATDNQSRIQVSATNVTERGFTAVFRSWAKSTVWEAIADYAAVADGTVVATPTLAPQSRFLWIPLFPVNNQVPQPNVTTNVNLSGIHNQGNIIISVGR
eukprot:gene3699-4608_t